MIFGGAMVFLYLFLAGVCLILCLSADRIGRYLGVIDQPDGGRKLHAAPTPLVGGIAISFPWLLAIVTGASLKSLPGTFMAFALGLALMFVVGLLDDRRHISALVRLIVSFGVFLALVLVEPHFVVSHLAFASLSKAFYLDPAVAIVFTALCVVGLQNALNMADGKNGLAIGILIIWSFILLQYAPAELYALLAVLCVFLVITLWFNLQGRLFLGDSGSYSLSMGVGFIAIYCYNSQAHPMPSETLALLFIVPVMDCLRVMARRLASGRSPFSPDRDHLHHYLSNWMPWERGLAIYLLLIGVPNAVAYLYPQLLTTMIFLTVTIYVVMILVLAREPIAEKRSTVLIGK